MAEFAFQPESIDRQNNKRQNLNHQNVIGTSKFNHTSKMCKFSRLFSLPLKISQFATKLKKKIETRISKTKKHAKTKKETQQEKS